MIASTHPFAYAAAVLCVICPALAVQAQNGIDGRPVADKVQPTLQWTPPEKRVYDALEKPISVDFFETPLEEALAIIAEQASIPVLLDGSALDVIGVDSGQPVTLRREGTALQSTLRSMLRSLDLSYVVRNGALVITLTEEAEQVCSTHVFPIGDLIQDADSGNKLVAMLSHLVQSDTWEASGGNGTMKVLDGLLIVHQTAPVLCELSETLGMMRSKPDPQQRILVSPSHQFETKFAASMSRPGPLDFFETPLEDCLQVVGEFVELPVGLDLAACDELGLDSGTPVTFSQSGMTMGGALDELLRPFDLVVIPRDDVLEFTSPEAAEQELTIRGYFVGDLLDAATQRTHNATSSADLISAIINTIDPDTWSDVGGHGTMEYWSGNQLLLVSQTYATHQKIGPLLAQIAAAQSGPRGSIQEWSERPVTEVYFLPQVDNARGALQPSQVADLIRLHLPDVSWHRDNLQTLTARVIVRQVPSVQHRVRKLINKLQYGVEDPSPAIGGGFRGGGFGGGDGGRASGGGVFRLAPIAGVKLPQAP